MSKHKSNLRTSADSTSQIKIWAEWVEFSVINLKATEQPNQVKDYPTLFKVSNV